MTREAKNTADSNGDSPPTAPTTRPDEAEEHTVLVVEDDQSVRGVVSNLLDSLGYRVITAAHGRDALVVSRGQVGRIDVVLADVGMRGITGRQLAEQLRLERPELAVVLMSGDPTGETDVQQAQRHGHFLRKPFDAADLARVMRTAIQSASSDAAPN